MTIRSAPLLAAAALAALTAPAFAQNYDPNLPPPLPELDESRVPAGDYERDGAWREDAARQGEWRDHPKTGDNHRGVWAGRHPGPNGQPGHPGTYPAGQYDAWLAQCRAAYAQAGGRRQGAVIGGTLGAIAGGIAGNEISDGDTGAALLGAGAGAVAGAVIGRAIAEDGDRRELDECEVALAHYQPGYGDFYGYGAYGYGYPPVMWVRVPIQSSHRHGSGCGCQKVVEEQVVEDVAPAPVVRQVKIQRVAPAPTKTVRSVK